MSVSASVKDAKGCLVLGLILSSGVAVSCGEMPESGAAGADPGPAPGPGGEPVSVVRGALTGWSTYVDDSAAPVHVQVRICTSDPAQHPSVDCPVDYDYALVGGGARARYTGNGAMLTESYPKTDGRTWHASSRDNVWPDSHPLEAYAIGVRLDGINAEVLRSTLLRHRQSAASPTSATAWPSGSAAVNTWFDSGLKVLGGGVVTSTAGAGQYLTNTWASDGTTWSGSSKDHWISSPGQVVVHALGLKPHDLLLRGFGLDIMQRIGFSTSVSSGLSQSPGWVSQGFALASIGGQSSFTSGGGRMLSRVGIYGDPTSADPRHVVAESIDHGDASPGMTTVTWTELRKTPGSHSICNAGGPLSGSTADSCVSNVCAQDPYCCQSAWDGICVGEVTSICGESCTSYSCSQPSRNLAFWNDGTASGSVQSRNNCYSYATNTPVAAGATAKAEPGRYAYGFVPCILNYDEDNNALPTSCYDAAIIGKYATADGLIPTTLAQGCTDGRSLIALAVKPGWDYHWYRRDADGTWSHKMGPAAAKAVDESGNTIWNPETANRGPYTQFGGYFCTCSSSTEGGGHAIIK